MNPVDTAICQNVSNEQTADNAANDPHYCYYLVSVEEGRVSSRDRLQIIVRPTDCLSLLTSHRRAHAYQRPTGRPLGRSVQGKGNLFFAVCPSRNTTTTTMAAGNCFCVFCFAPVVVCRRMSLSAWLFVLFAARVHCDAR